MIYVTNADIAHLNRAIKIAEQSTMRQRHGAVVAAGKRILGIGHNTFRTNPNNTENPKLESSYHAEVNALRQVIANDNVTMYVARINKRGNPVNSAPCTFCEDMLMSTGVKRVVFTINNGIGVMEL